ncbi:MAG: VPLPA-CTERM sorting domain-containing protein [Pseudomonadota bacterium]
MKITNLVFGACAAILCLGSAEPVSAAILYDGSAKTTNASVRPSGQAPLALFEFDVPAEITGITSYIDPDFSGFAKFLIFDGQNLALEITTQYLNTGGQQEFVSPDFSFNVVPGNEYSIGTVLNVGGQYFFGEGSDKQGPVNNIARNSNVLGFIAPTLGFSSGAAIGVTLSGTALSTVPIPAVAPMLLAALGALGFISRRRRAVPAA